MVPDLRTLTAHPLILAPSTSQQLYLAMPRRKAAKSNSSGAQQNDATMTYFQQGQTGLTVGPTSVLVMSVMFVGSVILLHMWAKIM